MTGLVQEENARRDQRLFHGWVTPLIRLGRSRPLSLNDLNPVPPPEDSLKETSALFRSAFRGNLLSALLLTFRKRLVRIFLLLFAMTCLNLLRPLLLRDLIARLTPTQSSEQRTFFSTFSSTEGLAFFAIGCFALLALIRSHFFRHAFKSTWIMPGLLRHELYRTLLRLSPSQRARLTTGEYVNIATRDCDATSMIAFLLEPLMYPLIVAVYCLMLVYFLGPWALLAVIALAGVIPMGRRLERRMRSLAAEIREQSKLRLGLLSEILSGIRVIKFHAWEERFERRVLDIREREIQLMRQRARVAARHSALSSLLPILTGASIVTLIAWISKVPSTADVFASFSVIASLVTLFSETPDVLQNVSELRVSLNRIKDFLVLGQKSAPDAEQASDSSASSAAVVMQNACYSRASADKNTTAYALKDVSLTVKAGQCVALVGRVGSGKSTLLSAIIDDLQLQSGSHKIPHPAAFAPQIPWNQNASVKDNVAFELPWNNELFEQAISAAALTHDLQQWPAGPDTEVGERGINLSGGQKQRLALARTLYATLAQDIQTIIWDDPFSALDESVAHHVFTQSFEHLLSHRTRIFSTHRIDFALRADWVIVMEEGRVVEQGRPKDLCAQTGLFSDLVRLHEQTRGQPTLSDAANTNIAPSQESSAQAPSGRLTSEEKMTLPIFNRSALRAYIKALAPALGLLGVILIFLLPRLTDIGSNFWLGYWTSHPETIALSQAVAVFAALTFATVVTERIRTVVLFDGGVQAGTTFFKRLMHGVFNAPMRFFDTSPQGRILNRFTSDTSAVDSSMPSALGQFLTSLVGIFASILPVIANQPYMALFLVPASALYVFLFKSVRGAQLSLSALSQMVRGPWMSLTAETLPGLSVIRSLQAEERFLARYQKLVNRHISTGFYSVAINLWFAFRLEILGVMLVGSFILATVFSKTPLSSTLIAVGLTFSLQLVGVLGGVARSLRMLENALVSVDRVNEYSNLPSETTPHTLEIPDAWPTHGRIDIKNLNVSYDTHLDPVLRGITLTIPASQKIGMVGRTGSGKSTLFLALTRMIPVPEGMIAIDGIDITHVPLKRLRQSIAMIPQDPVLFSGTLRDNLDPFEQSTDEALSIVLKRAHLEHICATAQAARTFAIEENGRNLSVGERQLVCLARALLSRSRILLIDEATANVDVATDAKIQQTLREEFTDCTRLVIAHRTNTLSDVDALVRLERGMLAVGLSPQAVAAELK